jgi:D-Tyr-tRNAtyr deacylase
MVVAILVKLVSQFTLFATMKGMRAHDDHSASCTYHRLQEPNLISIMR